MQRRRKDRVRRAKRQSLALRDEGRGCVVDENVERLFAPDRVHHGLDAGAVANVAPDRVNLAAGLAAHPGRGCLQHLKPSAADDQFGAKLDEAASYRCTEPGAAPGDQNALSRQQAFFKHGFKTPQQCAPCPGRGAAFFTMHRRAGTQDDAASTMDPGSAAHRHSASRTRVNALMALRSIRGTVPAFESDCRPASNPA